MKKDIYKYNISLEEEKALLFALLKQEVGYKRACELYDTAIENYDPIEYAVVKARNDIEKR